MFKVNSKDTRTTPLARIPQTVTNLIFSDNAVLIPWKKEMKVLHQTTIHKTKKIPEWVSKTKFAFTYQVKKMQKVKILVWLLFEKYESLNFFITFSFTGKNSAICLLLIGFCFDWFISHLVRWLLFTFLL